MRRTVPPSAEIQVEIDKLLSKGMVDEPQRMLSELARLGARLIIQRAVEDEFDTWLGRGRVVDEHGRIVEGRRYRHDEKGLGALCSRLVRVGVRLVALERPDGLLIDRLLDAGLAVVAIHPNQVKASRSRYSVAGGKSDAFDSFVLAELARTDTHRFRVLVRDSDRTKALRAMTRAREGLIRTRLSGKAKRAQFRCGCDHRLRDTFDTLADSSRHHNAWAAAMYDQARARGATHPHATRILGRALCQVIWRLWQAHQTYDPAKRQSHGG